VMGARAGAFLVLPGGIGTYDEFFDILAQKQLDRHRKPVILLDVDGYFAPLLALFEHGVRHRTIKPEHLGLFTVVKTPQEILATLA
jgi:uncharacterized protein (TIGR00730 family)